MFETSGPKSNLLNGQYDEDEDDDDDDEGDEAQIGLLLGTCKNGRKRGSKCMFCRVPFVCFHRHEWGIYKLKPASAFGFCHLVLVPRFDSTCPFWLEQAKRWRKKLNQ